jgi:ArsR family transcriptional regulator
MAMELDTALWIATLPPDFKVTEPMAELLQTVPPDWAAQWSDLLGRPRMLSVLGYLAWVAGVTAEDDYVQATLPMRELTLPQAIERVARLLSPHGLAPDPGLDQARQLADLIARAVPVMNDQLGLHPSAGDAVARDAAHDMATVARILAGGDLHGRFWLWLDRGYYEWYRPWRERRAADLDAEEQRATAALGGVSGEGAPATGWLSNFNPLVNIPELGAAAREGKTVIFFWAQPFGLYDLWSLVPGFLAVTFSEASESFHAEFRALAEGLANRVKALSDGNRLLILRMIRNFGKDNTAMAEYLGIARPAVSVHAKVLREAGLINTEHEGRGARHTINYTAMRELFRDLARFLELPDEE